jgi:hypothetical protein
MHLISSRMTFITKRVFPALWFGFLALFVVGALAGMGAGKDFRFEFLLIFALLLAVGHTSGGLSFWSPAGETEVLRAMRSFHFDAAGVSRTCLDFYLGFGFVTGIYLLMQAVVFWQLASIAKTDAFRVRPLIGSFLLANVVSAFLAWRFTGLHRVGRRRVP